MSYANNITLSWCYAFNQYMLTGLLFCCIWHTYFEGIITSNACSSFQIQVCNTKFYLYLLNIKLICNILTLKEPGFLDPSHSLLWGGGRIPPPPPKISETDWRNIKCVVLVDSYDPPESISTKKVQTYLVWRHSDVMSKTRKSPKLAKIMVFRYFFAIFSSKVAFFGNDMCQSILTHVLTPNKPNK